MDMFFAAFPTVMKRAQFVPTDHTEAIIAACQPFPPSTCVECGRKIPAGSMQKCEITVGGWCSHRIPAALRSRLEVTL